MIAQARTDPVESHGGGLHRAHGSLACTCRSLVAAAVLAVLHLVLPASPADAAYEMSERIDHREAGFPSASRKKGKELSTSRFHARNTCPTYGKAAAKVDLEAAMDQTLLRNHDNCRSGSLFLVLDDGRDGGAGTLAASNPRGTRLANPTVTGTILNRDWSLTARLVSFGYTAASRLESRSGEYVTAGIEDSRMTSRGLRIGLWRSREQGDPAGITNIDGGQWRDWTWGNFAHIADDGSTRPGSREMSHPDLLLGSWFLFTAGDSAAPGSHWPGRGHAAPMRLMGAHGRNGKGLVCPFGVDCERARLLAEAMPSNAIGAGGFSVSGRYGLGVSLSEVHPYVRVTLSRRLSVWWTYRF